jgi:Acetyltransferase (GNAT) domain
MAAVEFRDYQGDFEDIVALTERVWLPEYGGRIWFPMPEAGFLREKLSPQSGALCPVAYEGERLVGSVFSVPRTLRVAGVDYPVSMWTGFSVEPQHRRLALPLIERLRRSNEARGIAFGIGMVLDDPTSASYQFWTKYAASFPKSFRFMFNGGYLAKFLRPDAMARAGIMAWERIASRMFGPIVRGTPNAIDPNVRDYRPSDLDRCAELIEDMTRTVDWAMRWSREELALQLGGPSFTTLVYERDGKVQGLISCHSFPLQGRERIRCAFLDLWAHDELNFAERARLVGALCTRLRTQGIDGVVAARSSTMPTGALVANLFLPGAQHFKIGVFPTKLAPNLTPPRSWSFEIT